MDAEVMGGCAHGGIYSVDSKLVSLDFSSSVNPIGPPQSVIDVIRKESARLIPCYPDPECRELKRHVAKHVRCNESGICIGNGAIDLIHIFSRLFAKELAVIPAPTFCEYENAAQQNGASVRHVSLTDLRLDGDKFADACKGADAVFLCNPNNPTGILSTAEVTRVVERIDSSTMVMVDECFIELADRPQETLVERVSEFDNLVVLRSLTKSFALAGLRLGYSVSSPAIARQLEYMKVHWSVNGLAQAAGIAALQKSKSYLAKSRQLIKRERAMLQKTLAKTGRWSTVESQANYFLLDTGSQNSTRLRDELLKKSGILVRDCSTFSGMDSHHLRIAVRSRKENLKLISALESV